MKSRLMGFYHDVIVTMLPLLLLVACGGAGDAPQAPPPVSALTAGMGTVTGVAATGAPIIGVVKLKDSSVPSVEISGFTASDGSFILDTAGLKPPFLLKIATGGKNLYSMATTNTGIANIHPLTTVVMSVAAKGADLDALYLNSTPADLATLAAAIPAAEAQVSSVLAPMFTLYNVTGNLLNSSFSTAHVGASADALLDGIIVTLSAGPNSMITITKKVGGAVILTSPAASFGLGAGVTVANIPPVPVILPGEILYAANCSGCHGAIYTSTISGRNSVAQINNAIAVDFGGMSSLSWLTPVEIQDISTAITTLSTPPAPVAVTPPGSLPVGDTLYANNCASCHGALSASTKIGVSFVRLQNAISGNIGGMGKFSVLTAADMQAIVVALNNPLIVPPVVPASGVPAVSGVPATAPLSGAALYATNCSGCHGPLATSAKRGISIARFNAAIANNAATGMGYLSTLSATDVQNIVNALAIVTPAPTPPGGAASGVPATPGAALYATNCSGCHGPLATSAKGGATVLRIQSGIVNNPLSMGALSSLTAVQLNDIATALASVPAPIGTPVPACGSCHAVTLAGLASKTHGTHFTKPKAPNLAQFQATTSCGICHGAGYSTTTVVAATHNNGIKDVDVLVTKWIAPTLTVPKGTCAPACHTPAGAKRTW